MKRADVGLARYETTRSFVRAASASTPFVPLRHRTSKVLNLKPRPQKKAALPDRERAALSAITRRAHSSGGTTFFDALPKSPSADAARYANTAYAATFCASAFGSILSSVSSGVWW